MSIQAYQKTANRTADPRDVEFRLFAEVTRDLMEAQKADKFAFGQVVAALDKNRRVWNAMAMDCAQEGNGLPEELRAGIISLSLFVGRHTSEASRNRDEIETLIDINRNIMQGLAAAKGLPQSAADSSIAAA
ncbi:flagellar biosynthesis regulator FlaF [Hirschia litorea]|uniref:Flagellar biosynthesis regulator FlaF n=1 Tax=Hirschia litorea TaxID=1199156 RepID=A0ABW2IL81_9PROT